MVHKLVGKIIRFGRNANGNVVSAGASAKGTRYAIDLPTPVPASITRWVPVTSASRTSTAIAICSSRGS